MNSTVFLRLVSRNEERRGKDFKADEMRYLAKNDTRT